jgi:A/G-specific adenine glycosylase
MMVRVQSKPQHSLLATTPQPMSQSIAPPLLAWHRKHGRHDLPWQLQRTPYRVWVSEVMLQQTQVATVIGYYQRFMQRFPDVQTLAQAPQDEVLHLWSGLGYYARARNLQRAAQVIVEQHGGEFPDNFDAVAALPGIGRSTAGAILAIACSQRHPILDGNVRRVLARVHALPGATGERAFEQQLWQLAEAETPTQDVAIYTQAIMDLGATVCTRRPQCERCPLNRNCRAFAAGNPAHYPTPRRPLKRRQVERWMLFARREDGGVQLLRRPASGIWGGLWSPPEFATRDAAYAATASGIEPPQEAAPLQHAFTHFDLTIRPLWIRVGKAWPDANSIADSAARTLWYNPAAPVSIGLPAPIAALLTTGPALKEP